MECPSCEHQNVDNARFCAKCGALQPVQTAPENDPMIGMVIKNTFRVVRLLGEGGMGRVYEGEQQMGTTTRKVAIKTLHPHLSQDPQIVARFNRECGTVAELEHPNTIQFFDFGQTPDGTLFIAMEFIDGESICDIVEREGPMPPERVEHIMRQVCGSLAEAHSKGIVHRDLKPDNIVLTTRAGERDFAKVLDFGIAARTEATDAKKEQKLTQQGTVLGTPPYMSPEQFTGKELDNRSDIYSLGVMAYEMLTGKLPFDAETPWEWATKHLTERPYPFEVTAPRAAMIPDSMKQAIMRALSKDREQRQHDVNQFFEEFSGGGSSINSVTAAANSPVVHSGTAAMDAPPPELFQAAGFTSPGGAPYGNSPGFAGAGMTATPAMGQPSAPQLVPPMAPPVYAPHAPPARAKSSGVGKLLIFGAIAAALIVGALAVVLVVRGRSNSSDGDDRLDLTMPSASSTNTVTQIAPIATPTETAQAVDAASTATATPTFTTPTATAEIPPPTAIPKPTSPPQTKPTATAKPRIPEGDAACDQSISMARNGAIEAAVAAYRGCEKGGTRVALAKNTIRSNAKTAAEQAKFRGDCKRAQSIARAASSIGADGGATALASNCK